MKKAQINKDLCLGCGTCMAICPKGFALGGDGKAMVIAEVEESELTNVAASCPAGAISVNEQ